MGAGGRARGPAAGSGASGAHGRVGDPGRRAAIDTMTFRSAVSVSATGLVAYRTGGAGRRQLTWFDRFGKALGVMGGSDETISPLPSCRRTDFAWWPIGRWRETQTCGSWTALAVRFTSNEALDRFPHWSPEGGRIAFDSNRKKMRDLYVKRLSSGDGSGGLLLESPLDQGVMSWSRNGRFLLYRVLDPKTRSTNGDLWVVPMVGDRTPYVFLKTRFRVAYGAFSPDGRWVAYQSNESGRSEIYVRPFVPPGAGKRASVEDQWQVSQAGGIHPAWRPDGKELDHLNPAAAMMARTNYRHRVQPRAGHTKGALSLTRIVSGGTDVTQGRLGRQYDVAPDGRFLDQHVSG